MNKITIKAIELHYKKEIDFFCAEITYSFQFKANKSFKEKSHSFNSWGLKYQFHHTLI